MSPRLQVLRQRPRAAKRRTGLLIPGSSLARSPPGAASVARGARGVARGRPSGAAVAAGRCLLVHGLHCGCVPWLPPGRRRRDAERHLSLQDQRQGPLVSSPRGPRASRTMWCGVWCVCGTLGNRNALAAPSTFAAGASRVQVKFTTCMPTQHGTAKFPKAFTFLPLSVQLGRMPSHLHIASGCNDMGPKRLVAGFGASI